MSIKDNIRQIPNGGYATNCLTSTLQKLLRSSKTRKHTVTAKRRLKRQD